MRRNKNQKWEQQIIDIWKTVSEIKTELRMHRWILGLVLSATVAIFIKLVV